MIECTNKYFTTSPRRYTIQLIFLFPHGSGNLLLQNWLTRRNPETAWFNKEYRKTELPGLQNHLNWKQYRNKWIHSTMKFGVFTRWSEVNNDNDNASIFFKRSYAHTGLQGLYYRRKLIMLNQQDSIRNIYILSKYNRHAQAWERMSTCEY